MLSPLLSLPPAVAAAVALLIVALIALGLSMRQMLHGKRARMKRRLARIIGESGGSETEAGRPDRRRSVQNRLKLAEKSRRQTRGYRLQEQLRLAGFGIGLRPFIGGCLGAALVGLLVARLGGLSWFGALLAAPIVGFGLPKLVLSRLAKRRVRLFGSQFADAIDIIVRGIRTGLPLGECLAIIGREMADPIGGEFRRIIEDQKLGLPLAEALERAVIRMPVADFRYFSIVIAIQQQTGGNLAETLAKLSETLRARKRMRDKIQAYSSEARTSSYIIGALPVVVIGALSAVSPKYVGVLFNTDAGNLVALLGVVTEIAGLWIMNKMISFDI
jgi:tight adherence protein B